MLLTILHCAGQYPTTKNPLTPILIVLRSRNPAEDLVPGVYHKNSYSYWIKCHFSPLLRSPCWFDFCVLCLLCTLVLPCCVWNLTLNLACLTLICHFGFSRSLTWIFNWSSIHMDPQSHHQSNFWYSCCENPHCQSLPTRSYHKKRNGEVGLIHSSLR